MEKHCVNYLVCNNKVIFTGETCIDCYCMFGNWRNRKEALHIEYSNKPCQVCSYIGKTVLRPTCEHHICINCFRKAYFGIDPEIPKFPYPDREFEYYVKIQSDSEDEWLKEEIILKYLKDMEYLSNFIEIHNTLSHKCPECI